jgi:hypothetical protein
MLEAVLGQQINFQHRNKIWRLQKGSITTVSMEGPEPLQWVSLIYFSLKFLPRTDIIKILAAVPGVFYTSEL